MYCSMHPDCIIENCYDIILIIATALFICKIEKKSVTTTDNILT